jgi:hypothetical protein
MVDCSRIYYTRLFVQGLHDPNADIKVADEIICSSCGQLLGDVCFLKWSLRKLAGLSPLCPMCRKSDFCFSAEVEAARWDVHV